jgi:hypothetical protein
MYRGHEDRNVEKVCYEHDHIRKVLKIIKENFSSYFNDFINNEAITGISEEKIKNIISSLGIESYVKKTIYNKEQNFKNILALGLYEFEKDRKKYLDIFDKESLEEYRDDPSAFKSKTLRHECPIINSTLQNVRAKALDKYRQDYNLADANELLKVVINLYNFAENYVVNAYDPVSYDNIIDYSKLFFSELDTESCTVYGVIGGGIKSQMLYKLYPSVFPNRSRMSIWALWYLTNKQAIDCKMDSEYLMIDIKNTISQQNYFYPYELFAFYAHQIFQYINEEAKKIEVYINPEFRYVVVDSFLDCISNTHIEEINLLMSQIKESDNGYT